MAQGYADEHHILITRDNQTRDITAFCADIELNDRLDALSVELSFRVFLSPQDKYTPKLNLFPGDKVRVVNHGNTVFSGVVVTAFLNGSVTCYDRGWYLNKSEIIFQANGIAADECIKQACSKAGVSAASIAAMATKITKTWNGEPPSQILSEVLDAVHAETGKRYRFRVGENGLVVSPLPTAAIKAYHRPASNVAAFDITWALGEISGEDSMDELANAVVISAEANGQVFRGASAKNAGSVAKYGFIQKIHTVTENPGTAKLGQMAKNLLDEADRIRQTREISEIWGCDEVTSGVVLNFNSPAFGLSGLHRVTDVRHHIGTAGHTMSLTVEALSQGRAAGGSDIVSVQGLPDLSSSSGGGGISAVMAALGYAGGGTSIGNAAGAAAFLSVAQSQLGIRESRGNHVKYAAHYGADGEPWCCFFVSWCAEKSGAPIPANGYVGAMTDHFRAKGLYRSSGSYRPKPGDLFVQSDRHIGIVWKVNQFSFETIEGNYSDSVATVTRSFSSATGFLLPWG